MAAELFSASRQHVEPMGAMTLTDTVCDYVRRVDLFKDHAGAAPF
jgi:hypothetical protein